MKTDYELGLAVHEHLRSKGLETPVNMYNFNQLADWAKIELLTEKFYEIFTTLGLDLTDDSLQDTPTRVAKMWVNELFAGLDYKKFPKVTAIDNKMGCDEMVLVSNITANSTCEHHIITIDQKVHIAYIPSTKVIGLSKLSRIAKFFAQRPQVQERYTAQVFEALKFLLKTEDIAVSVEGRHFCMISRGVEDVTASTITNKFGGSFKEREATRAEFLKMISK